MNIYKYHIYDIHIHMSVCVKKNHACSYEECKFLSSVFKEERSPHDIALVSLFGQKLVGILPLLKYDISDFKCMLIKTG